LARPLTSRLLVDDGALGDVAFFVAAAVFPAEARLVFFGFRLVTGMRNSPPVCLYLPPIATGATLGAALPPAFAATGAR